MEQIPFCFWISNKIKMNEWMVTFLSHNSHHFLLILEYLSCRTASIGPNKCKIKNVSLQTVCIFIVLILVILIVWLYCFNLTYFPPSPGFCKVFCRPILREKPLRTIQCASDQFESWTDSEHRYLARSIHWRESTQMNHPCANTHSVVQFVNSVQKILQIMF